MPTWCMRVATAFTCAVELELVSWVGMALQR